MPFRSEKQRRFLWAEHPDIAKRWAREYPKQRNLPEYAHKTTETTETKEPEKSKEAAMARIPAKNNVTHRNTVVNYVAALTAKYANSAATHVEVPHSDKPTSAGDEHVSLKGPDQEGQLLGQLSKEQQKPPVNETLRKLAVVLSQVVQQGIADQEAAAQGQEAAPVPQNVNMSQSGPQPSTTPLPMDMQQAQAPAQPQQPQAGAAPVAAAPAQKAANIAPMPAGPQATKPAAPAVGSKPGIKPIKPMAAEGTSPMFNPIQSFGGLSSTGDINGNAGLGVKNSPDSLKTAAASKPCSCGCGATVTTCKCGPSCKCRKPGGSCYKPADEKSAALGLWDRIRMKKERGGKPAKPGDKDYPDTKSWKKVTDISSEKQSGTPAWQRSAGKNEEGGLNAKGRASYNKATGGHLKAPVTEKHPTGKAKARRHSFCSRMCGMKRENTGASTAKDPDSRINKSLRKWNCKCSSAAQFGAKLAYELGQQG